MTFRIELPPVTARRVGVQSPTKESKCVYHMIDKDGFVIYVGATSERRSRARLREHRKYSKWWPEVESIYIEIVEDRSAASSLEASRIGSLKPRHNKDFNGDHTQEHCNPGYKPFDPFKGRMCGDSTCKFASNCGRFNGGDTSDQASLYECHQSTKGTDSYIREYKFRRAECEKRYPHLVDKQYPNKEAA